MDLTDQNLADVVAVLESAGFTSAWALDDDSQNEIIFLVPKQEGDFASIEESPSTQRLAYALMAVLPHTKVAVLADRDDVPKTRVF